MDDVIDLKNVKKIFLASKIGIIEKIFGRKPVYVNALDDVNLQIKKGTTLGVVGESGSGKTTLAKIIATLEEPTSGELIFEGQVIKPNNSDLVRDKLSMVFQNPATSVNPRMKVVELLTETLGRFDRNRINDVLVSVGK